MHEFNANSLTHYVTRIAPLVIRSENQEPHFVTSDPCIHSKILSLNLEVFKLECVVPKICIHTFRNLSHKNTHTCRPSTPFTLHWTHWLQNISHKFKDLLTTAQGCVVPKTADDTHLQTFQIASANPIQDTSQGHCLGLEIFELHWRVLLKIICTTRQGIFHIVSHPEFTDLRIHSEILATTWNGLILYTMAKSCFHPYPTPISKLLVEKFNNQIFQWNCPPSSSNLTFTNLIYSHKIISTSQKRKSTVRRRFIPRAKTSALLPVTPLYILQHILQSKCRISRHS